MSTKVKIPKAKKKGCNEFLCISPLFESIEVPKTLVMGVNSAPQNSYRGNQFNDDKKIVQLLEQLNDNLGKNYSSS